MSTEKKPTIATEHFAIISKASAYKLADLGTSLKNRRGHFYRRISKCFIRRQESSSRHAGFKATYCFIAKKWLNDTINCSKIKLTCVTNLLAAGMKQCYLF